MARVVTRRSAPPYLLIVFAFLFVIAAVLAVLGYMDADKADQEVTAIKKKLNEADADNLDMKQQLGDLVQAITGKPGSSKDAVVAAKGIYDKRDAIAAAIKADPNLTAAGAAVKGIDTGISGLAPDMVALAQLHQETLTILADKNKLINELNAKLAAFTETMQVEMGKNEKAYAALVAEKESLNKKLEENQASHSKSLDQVKQSMDNSRKELETKITTLETQIQEMVVQRSKLNALMTKQQREIAILKAKLGAPNLADANNSTDGQIIKTAENSDVVYINLGKKDNIRQGMTFAVYGKGSDNKMETKGSIRVINVTETVSECQIIAQASKDDPIVAGDNVANLVFNTSRAYVFVVKGDFDLYNSGMPNKAGHDEIVQIIKRFGGKVAEDLDFETDYVVLGVEPLKPVKPADDSIDTNQQVYQKQLKEWNQFNALQTRAEEMKIPVLNTNRFLTFTGYMPEKRPE